MNFTVDGTVAQSAHLTIGDGDAVWASRGSIIAYSAGVRWNIKMPGGFGSALKRLPVGADAGRVTFSMARRATRVDPLAALRQE